MRLALVLLLISCVKLMGQTNLPIDSLSLNGISVVDSLTEKSSKTDTSKFKNIIRNTGMTLGQSFGIKPFTEVERPKIAFIRSTILPGWGQATNKDFWKLPIIYAAAGTGYYFGIYQNQQRYIAYREARVQLFALDQGNVNLNSVSLNNSNVYFTVEANSTTFDITKSSILFSPDGESFYTMNRTTNLNPKQAPEDTEYILEPFAGVELSQIRGPFDVDRVENGMNQFRRFRDLSRIGFAVGWILFATEAHVAAHLDSFDVSDDISFTLKPTPILVGFNPIPGLSLKLNF